MVRAPGQLVRTAARKPDLERRRALPQGRGGYGRVFKGRWKGAVVAVKVVEHSAFGTDADVAAAEERRAAR